MMEFEVTSNANLTLNPQAASAIKALIHEQVEALSLPDLSLLQAMFAEKKQERSLALNMLLLEKKRAETQGQLAALRIHERHAPQAEETPASDYQSAITRLAGRSQS